MAIPQLAAQAMMQMYREDQDRGGFLSAWFRPVRNSTGSTGTSLVWDSQRFSRKIAGTIDHGTGSNLNEAARFSTKEFEPPEYGEAVAINAHDLVTRMAGEDPFSASNRSYASRFIKLVGDALLESGRLIDRGVEVQAAQIMQTGQLSLAGASPYSADFKPKASHFVTVGTAWSDSVNAVPLDDIENLAHTIRVDSKKRVTTAIMGRTALKEFLECDQVKERADLRRVNMLAIDPRIDNRGAHLYGTIIAGGYEINLWQYDQMYEPFAGGAEVPYVDDNKVILLPDRPSFVIGSLLVPQILGPDPRLAGLVSVPTTSELGWDLTPNVWTHGEGSTIYAGMKTRVGMIPQGIDEFGALTT